MSEFEDLVEEANCAPIEGWDFSWLDGRATEARPSWRYSERVVERAVTASRILELQSGDGALVGALSQPPLLLVASDAYLPNVTIAKTRLLNVVACADHALPFRTRGSFAATSTRFLIEARKPN